MKTRKEKMSTENHNRLARDRIAILTALNEAAQDPHRVLDLVISSRDRKHAIGMLATTYNWSSTQAQAVLNIQVGQWSETARESIAADLAQATSPVDQDG